MRTHIPQPQAGIIYRKHNMFPKKKIKKIKLNSEDPAFKFQTLKTNLTYMQCFSLPTLQVDPL